MSGSELPGVRIVNTLPETSQVWTSSSWLVTRRSASAIRRRRPRGTPFAPSP
jgi:hypothetical protein